MKVKVKLYLDKNIHENASLYYEMAKNLMKKVKRAKESLKTLEEKIENRKKSKEEKKERKNKSRMEWYMNYGYSFTSKGKLILFGRNDEENYKIYKRHLKDNDLFFHVEKFQGSTVILKEGENASEEEKEEAAKIAVCYSKAWKEGVTAATAYAVRKWQIIPVGKAKYNFQGRREYFLKLPLGLFVWTDGTKPMITAWKPKGVKPLFFLKPGKEKKDATAKLLSKALGVEEGLIKSLLPPCCFSLLKIT